jgi:hypothetical protein
MSYDPEAVVTLRFIKAVRDSYGDKSMPPSDEDKDYIRAVAEQFERDFAADDNDDYHLGGSFILALAVAQMAGYIGDTAWDNDWIDSLIETFVGAKDVPE